MRALAWILSAAFLTAASQPLPVTPAKPVNANDGILDLYKTYRVVCLGEGPHNNQQGHAFRLSLIRDPRFPTLVNDIVVEFGTARYQDVMDRYVRGETVRYEELRHVWQDTVAPAAVWDRPMYYEFFTAVRDLNRRLPKDGQLRVLLGDPPIAWEAVRGPADLRRWNLQRDPHAAALINREVLARNRRALVIYGDGHFQGRGFPAPSIVKQLETKFGEKVFTISNAFSDLKRFQPDAASWKVPSLARIMDTPIGQRFYAQFYPMPPAKGWNTVLMQDQFDAVLYLGGPTVMTMMPLPASLCADPAYMKMRLSRLALQGDARGDPTAGLKSYCVAVSKR